ncbi:hypothetical protein G6F23_010785 [Rhizopus arrhizus]|nr:hypothetical protein G6F23_010785 [Rhizopus arrhizus]
MLNIIPLWSSIDGRVLAAQVSHTSGLYNPINIFVIYVPVQHRERIEFLRSFPTIMLFDQLLTSRSILLGDFNHNIHTRSSSLSLAQWFQWIHLNWHDPINSNPEHNNIPTFRNISTIDFLLITADLIDMVDNHDIKYVARCDHSAISTYLTLGCTRTGPGIWRCNPYLVQDPHFRTELTAFCTNAEHFLSDLGTPLLWDLLKCRLKSFIQTFSNKAAAQHDGTNAQIASVESQLELQYEHSSSVLALRSGQRWREQGERSNTYFYRYLRQRQRQQYISSIRTDIGTIVTEPLDLTETAREYYEELYSLEPIDEQATSDLLAHVSDSASISPDVHESLINYWTVDEWTGSHMSY